MLTFHFIVIFPTAPFPRAESPPHRFYAFYKGLKLKLFLTPQTLYNGKFYRGICLILALPLALRFGGRLQP